jgi:hypothetical protein
MSFKLDSYIIYVYFFHYSYAIFVYLCHRDEPPQASQAEHKKQNYSTQRAMRSLEIIFCALLQAISIYYRGYI